MTRDEALREAIASKLISYEDMVATIGNALRDAMQAVDYEDFGFALEQAQYAADVLKTMARR